jgi:hypothetical protein
MDDPLKKRTSGVGLSVGLLNSGDQSGSRFEIAPLASANRIGTLVKESQLDVLTTTLDYTNNRWALNELRLLKVASTPNAHQFNSPWSWGVGVSINRYNSSRLLAREFQIELGKTYVLNRVRTEVTVGSGIQNQSATSAYLNPKIVMLYQFSDVAELGASVEEKIFATGVYQMRAAFIAFGNSEVLILNMCLFTKCRFKTVEQHVMKNSAITKMNPHSFTTVGFFLWATMPRLRFSA